MVLEITLGIIIAFIVLSLGQGAVWFAVIAAAFYFGFGPLVILIAAFAALVFALSCIGVGISALGRRLTSRAKRQRELQWYERKEPTMKSPD